MSKPTAVVNDVQATAASTKAELDKDGTGAWQAGTVTYQSYSRLTIQGKPVIYQASCTFTYTGGTASGNPVTVLPDTVTLKAGTTLLQKGANKVLVDGDQITSSSGNKLEVHASHIVSTA